MWSICEICLVANLNVVYRIFRGKFTQTMSSNLGKTFTVDQKFAFKAEQK